MAKVKKEYDAEGVKLTMRKRDYMADMSGQLALGLMANLVGQMQYFYTDKVGLAVGSVGVVMAISKILDAFTDVIFGNIIDHSRGGNKKYFRWMISLAIPAAAIVALMFMVPKNAASGAQVAYALVTNVLLSAVIYTMIATPFSAVMVVRTKSNSERASMGVFRAVGNYGAGMIIAIATIPVTNMLGGTQDAWIKYGVVLALFVLLLFLICWLNGHKAAFTREAEGESGVPAQAEEEPVPFGPAMGMLFKNKYWVIVLLFNLITAVTNAISASSAAYYTKWIFGNDNLVALLGGLGLAATVVGFILSKPIIAKLGVTKTVSFGCLGAALFAGIPYTDNAKAPFEHYFQSVIFIVFTLLGQMVKCEAHSSRGRADCIVETKDFVYIFEFKLDKSAEEALAQIEEKQYALPYAADARTLYKIGVSFASASRSLAEWKAESR